MPKYTPAFALLLIMACLIAPAIAHAEEPDGFRGDKFMTSRSDYTNLTLVEEQPGEPWTIRIYRKQGEILNYNGIPLKDVLYHFYVDEIGESLGDVVIYFHDQQSYQAFVDYLHTRYGQPESEYELDYYWRWYAMEQLGGVAIYTSANPQENEFFVGFGIVPID